MPTLRSRIGGGVRVSTVGGGATRVVGVVELFLVFESASASITFSVSANVLPSSETETRATIGPAARRRSAGFRAHS
jgi:hypothetical protein